MKIVASVLVAVAALGLGVVYTLSDTAEAVTSFGLTFQSVDMLPVGSTLDLGTFPVPAELQGQNCVATTTNNNSVHTGSSLLLTSGTSSVTLADPEGATGKVVNGNITLGATVHAVATIGQDPDYPVGLGGFSIGSATIGQCTTTTTVPPTTTQPPFTPVPPTPITGVIPKQAG
jgi:hypothetical protein